MEDPEIIWLNGQWSSLWCQSHMGTN